MWGESERNGALLDLRQRQIQSCALNMALIGSRNSSWRKTLEIEFLYALNADVAAAETSERSR